MKANISSTLKTSLTALNTTRNFVQGFVKNSINKNKNNLTVLRIFFSGVFIDTIRDSFKIYLVMFAFFLFYSSVIGESVNIHNAVTDPVSAIIVIGPFVIIYIKNFFMNLTQLFKVLYSD